MFKRKEILAFSAVSGYNKLIHYKDFVRGYTCVLKIIGIAGLQVLSG